MNEPIVFISRSRIIERDREAFGSAVAGAARVIESTKPRTAMFAAYVDEPMDEVRIVHIFPDAAALGTHFEGAEQRTRSASRLFEPTDFQVYGEAPTYAVEMLRREAHAAGGSVELWPRGVGGFLRAPA